MNYSTKLKEAMEEIKEVLQRYDIAATVVLHTPGFSEYLYHINPSYSCAKIEGDSLRIRAKLDEDFAGDKEAWTKKVTDTANMFMSIIDINNMLLRNTGEAIKMLGKHVEIHHTTGEHTPHNENTGSDEM